MADHTDRQPVVDRGARGAVTRVTAVVLAYGSEPWLDACLASLLDSRGVEVDVVLVDNGCTDLAAVDRAAAQDHVVLVRPAENLGYAGGCDVGADHAAGDVIAFVNSDAVVVPGALAALATTLEDRSVGLVTASIRLADDPAVLNTAGNPVHVTGLSWAGHHGEPAERWNEPRDVASVSGAAFAVRRDLWRQVGGFDPTWFAYNEDADLSLRVWQRGLRVRYCPDAVVVHHYEFSRNPDKSYLLERNRLLNVLTLYAARTLVLLAPVLVVFELMLVALAARQGWLAEKWAGYRWIAAHHRWVRERRREVQAARVVSDRVVAEVLTSRLDPGNVALPGGVGIVNALVTAYWWLARRML
jgi:GT2 family glycosyltransferase